MVFSYQYLWWYGSKSEMSIVVRWSKCRQYSSVHPWARWDFLYFSSCATWLWLCPHCVSMLLFRHSLLSNVLLPLRLSVLVASWMIHSCKIIRGSQSLESGFDTVYCVCVGSKTNATTTEFEQLWQVLQARMTLVGSGYLSQLEQFHVAHLVNHATWFVAERQRVFCFSKASRIDFGREPFLHFSNTSLTFPIRSSSFKIASLCNSFNSEVDKWLTTSRQFPFALWFWVLFCSYSLDPLSSICTLRTSFLVRVDPLSESCCCCGCCCCCDCQAVLSTIFGSSRGGESLSNKVRSPFWEITLQMQSAGRELCTISAWDLVWQKRNLLSCARIKLIQ